MDVVHGHCDDRFAPVREAFDRNFRTNGEVGAALCVTLHGRPVVDLWGGIRDAASAAPWEADTMVCMMSVAKGITAVALAMAYDRGLVDLNAPVAAYWPAFAASGKQAVTVRQAGSHLAGVPVADAAADGAIYDYEAMKAAIAAQAPLWPPGETQVYHSATIGHIMGAIIEGATGIPLPRFLREELAGPLGAEYFIGLTPAEEARCATMIPSANNLVSASKHAPRDSVEYRAFRPMPVEEDFNSHLWRAATIPAVNGHGTPRAVARIYGALANGGKVDGVTLGRPESFAALAKEQSRGTKPNPDAYLRMGIGFMLNSPPVRPMGPNQESFGFSGAGGAQGFADPIAGLGYCYGATPCMMGAILVFVPNHSWTRRSDAFESRAPGIGWPICCLLPRLWSWTSAQAPAATHAPSSRGYDVIAVESSSGMRTEAGRRHPSSRIQWMADSLPSLNATSRLGLAADVSSLSAVWQRSAPPDRPRAFRKLVGLLRSGGLLVLTLRHGPDDGRRLWGERGRDRDPGRCRRPRGLARGCRSRVPDAGKLPDIPSGWPQSWKRPAAERHVLAPHLFSTNPPWPRSAACPSRDTSGRRYSVSPHWSSRRWSPSGRGRCKATPPTKGRKIDIRAIATAMTWSDPTRDVALPRSRAMSLIAGGQAVHCARSGRRLTPGNLDVDHCLP